MKDNLFIPMYIDKVKLFDLNSIICGGFSEFNEITISTDNNSSTEVKANMGFNLFKLSGILMLVQMMEKVKKLQEIVNIYKLLHLCFPIFLAN